MTDNESTEGTEQSSEETLDYEAALAKLNEEYDRERPEQTQQKAESPDDLAALKAEIAALKSHVQGDQTEKAIEATVKAVKGDNELAIPDKYLRKLIVGMVSDDARAMQLYMNREKNPQGWKQYLDLTSREIAKDFGKKDSADTSDIEAVEASVRGQHTASESRKIDATKTGNMSPQEYAKWKADLLA